MHQPASGPLPCDRHVERSQCQIMAEVVGHRPADHTARGEVEHDGQVELTLRGLDVGEVRQPDAVGGRGGKVAPEQVRGDREGMPTVGCAPEPPLAPRLPAHRQHQSSNALAADTPAMGTQLGMHARAAIAAAAGGVGRADLGGQCPVSCRPTALRPGGPVVVAAAAHLQHLAQDRDRKAGDVIANEGITHLRPVAWPKMSAARFKMSRSMRTRSSSRRSRAISAAWSAGFGPTRRAGTACSLGGVGAGAPLTAAPPRSSQCSRERNNRSGSPNSAAICDTGRPPRTAATASCLNASGKNRRLLVLSTTRSSKALKPIRGVRHSGGSPAQLSRDGFASAVSRRGPAPHSGLGDVRSPRFRRIPFIRNGVSDHGRPVAPRMTVRNMLPSALSTASASAGLSLSRLNIPLHMIAVYASQPSSPATTQHSLEGGSLLPYPHPSFTGWTAPASPGALITDLIESAGRGGPCRVATCLTRLPSI